MKKKCQISQHRYAPDTQLCTRYCPTALRTPRSYVCAVAVLHITIDQHTAPSPLSSCSPLLSLVRRDAEMHITLPILLTFSFCQNRTPGFRRRRPFFFFPFFVFTTNQLTGKATDFGKKRGLLKVFPSPLDNKS
jgi:hypothetical protein